MLAVFGNRGFGHRNQRTITLARQLQRLRRQNRIRMGERTEGHLPDNFLRSFLERLMQLDSLL